MFHVQIIHKNGRKIIGKYAEMPETYAYLQTVLDDALIMLAGEVWDGWTIEIILNDSNSPTRTFNGQCEFKMKQKRVIVRVYTQAHGLGEDYVLFVLAHELGHVYDGFANGNEQSNRLAPYWYCDHADNQRRTNYELRTVEIMANRFAHLLLPDNTYATQRFVN